MNMIAGLKEFVRTRILPQLSPRLMAAARAAHYKLLATPEDRAAWKRRIQLALACPDNVHIHHVAGAGRIRAGYQLMHNGIEVIAGGYYGSPMRDMLSLNRGVHEPQEERAFQEILPSLAPGGTTLELGAYWGFYSLWFQRQLKGRCILVEPDPLSLAVGKHNFACNGMTGEFEQAFIGRTSGPGPGGVAMKCIDDIVAERHIDHLTILHSDIQGAELDMLLGADKLLREGRVDYLFVSTHGNELHRGCEDHLRALGYQIVASIDKDDTFSEDGVLIAKRAGVAGPDEIQLSRRTRAA